MFQRRYTDAHTGSTEHAVNTLNVTHTYTSNLKCFQANARLPDADAEIVDVTPELVEAATVISEQLVMATDREEAPVPLLPLDLNTTNNVVAQVRDNLLTMMINPYVHWTESMIYLSHCMVIRC